MTSFYSLPLLLDSRSKDLWNDEKGTLHVSVLLVLAFTTYYSLPTICCFSLCGAKSFAFISFCFRFAFALSSSYLLFPSHCPCSWIPDQKPSGMTRGGLYMSQFFSFWLLLLTIPYLLSAVFPSVFSVYSVVQSLSLFVFCFFYPLAPIY